MSKEEKVEVQDSVENKSPSSPDVYKDTSTAGDSSAQEGTDQQRKKRRRRRKVVLNLKCQLCETGIKSVSYKDVYQLKKYTSVRGKIISTEKSGVCHKHQKQLTRAIKRARYLSLLPYVAADK